MKRQYTVGEMRRIIAESASEFKPVKFNDDNKKINEKSYKEMKSATKDYDGKVSAKKSKTTNYPPNYRGMETLRPLNMTDEMRKRFDAQLDGYVDEKHKKAHEKDPFGNAEFGDGSLGKALAQRSDEEESGRTKAAQIGLTGSKSNIKGDDGNMFESKRINKLTFKRTTFLTENHMLSKVPDDYKVEGKKFIMRDGQNNEYLVEWHEEPIVTNKTKINEEQNRIKELFNYKSQVVTSSNYTRLAENKSFDDVLGKARRLMK